MGRGIWGGAVCGSRMKGFESGRLKVERGEWKVEGGK